MMGDYAFIVQMMRADIKIKLPKLEKSQLRIL
jgi:hypothetical protein